MPGDRRRDPHLQLCPLKPLSFLFHLNGPARWSLRTHCAPFLTITLSCLEDESSLPCVCDLPPGGHLSLCQRLLAPHVGPRRWYTLNK